MNKARVPAPIAFAIFALFRRVASQKELALICAILCFAGMAHAQIIVEAESFREKGDWTNDAQFIDPMGSPCLLAVGLGVCRETC